MQAARAPPPPFTLTPLPADFVAYTSLWARLSTYLAVTKWFDSSATVAIGSASRRTGCNACGFSTSNPADATRIKSASPSSSTSEASGHVPECPGGMVGVDAMWTRLSSRWALQRRLVVDGVTPLCLCQQRANRTQMTHQSMCRKT